MINWIEKELGDLLTQRKEQIVIQPEIEYSLVTISKTGEVRLREKKIGALIRAKKGYITKAGDFIYSRLSVHTGAFGIVPEELDNALITNEMPSFIIDKTQILPEILLDLIGMPEFQWKLKQLTKGMGRVRIKESMMLGLKINFPESSKQQQFVDKIKSVKGHKLGLATEITHQQILLKKLRQQILQEAIEGKLTADWRQQNPDVEPASELLARIQAEKAQLIKEKKIKKQKPLPPITEEEKPFTLPEGWVWCRLGEIVIKYEAGKSYKCTDRQVIKNEWGVIKTSAVTSSIFQESEHKYYQTQQPLDISKKINNGDLVFCRASGSKGLAGKCCIVTNISRNLLLSDKTPRLIVSKFSDKMYVYFHNETKHTGIYYSGLNTGKSTSMNNITKDQLLGKPIPLPPLPEQKAIVAKVEKLLALCDQLESQITTNQTHAEQLMQAVLREAFSQSSEQPEQEAAYA